MLNGSFTRFLHHERDRQPRNPGHLLYGLKLIVPRILSDSENEPENWGNGLSIQDMTKSLRTRGIRLGVSGSKSECGENISVYTGETPFVGEATIDLRRQNKTTDIFKAWNKL